MGDREQAGKKQESKGEGRKKKISRQVNSTRETAQSKARQSDGVIEAEAAGPATAEDIKKRNADRHKRGRQKAVARCHQRGGRNKRVQKDRGKSRARKGNNNKSGQQHKQIISSQAACTEQSVDIKRIN